MLKARLGLEVGGGGWGKQLGLFKCNIDASVGTGSVQEDVHVTACGFRLVDLCL